MATGTAIGQVGTEFRVTLTSAAIARASWTTPGDVGNVNADVPLVVNDRFFWDHFGHA